MLTRIRQTQKNRYYRYSVVCCSDKRKYTSKVERRNIKKKEEKNKKKWVVTKCAEIDLIKEYYMQVLQMSH